MNRHRLYRLSSILCLTFAAIAAGRQIRCSETSETAKRIFCVRDYGAVGDDETLDTEALQKTIDVCGQKGDGTVRFDKGVYLSGSLFLRSGVRIRLEHDAVLLGNSRQSDYQYIEQYDQAKIDPKNPCAAKYAYLIYADGIENATVEGLGTIDGNGESFWEKPKTGNYCTCPTAFHEGKCSMFSGFWLFRFSDTEFSGLYLSI